MSDRKSYKKERKRKILDEKLGSNKNPKKDEKNEDSRSRKEDSRKEESRSKKEDSRKEDSRKEESRSKKEDSRKEDSRSKKEENKQNKGDSKSKKEDTKTLKEEIKPTEEKPKEEKPKEENKISEEEKKRQRLLAWKKTQQKLGITDKKSEGTNTTEQEKKEDTKDNKMDTKMEEDSLDSFMIGINNQVKEIMAKDEKKYSNEAIKKEVVDAPKVEPIRKGLDEEEEIEFKDIDETSELMIPSTEPKKKLFEVVDHSTMNYKPFRKNFYVETEEIKKMTDKEVKKYRRKLDHIKVTGKNCPKPIKTFAQCGLSDKLLKVLKLKNYVNPTPIQCQAIPALMKGEDVIGIAKTGSGKTLAFLLPMFRHILDQPPLEENDGPIALLMAPTRELALQIHQEAKIFCKAVKLRSVCIYGGGAVQNQISKLKKGAEIVVATPGRLIEILSLNNGRITNLKRLTYVVLDEADRMFDMGFEPQIMRVITNIRPDRQTAMFSATFPQKVELLARKALKKPIAIVIGGRLKVSDQIEQNVEVRSEISKFSRLIELLEEHQSKGSIIIFVDKQEEADTLFKKILEKGYVCDSLHGGKDQLDRLSTIEDFKNHRIKILIATSVAARGLDVKDLNMVINYDMPNHIEDYVHRVGRTGRAGNKGISYTFIDPEDDHFAPHLVRLLKSGKQKIPEELEKLAKSYELKKGAGIKVKGIHDGYVGQHGYKFDSSEANKKSDELKKHLKALGLDDNDEEPEDSENQDNDEKKDLQEDKVKEKVKIEEKDAIIKKIEPVSSTSSEDSVTNQAISQIQKYKFNTFTNKEDAKKNVLEFTNFLVNKNKMMKEQQQQQKAIENQTRWQCEIEINDYPQQSRWRVTQKDALAEISEMTETAIITKGTYVVPGRKPPPGQRKLYLQIEGGSELAVKLAKKEVYRRISEEASSEQAMAEKTMYAKYSVL